METTVLGTARAAKSGACIVSDDGVVYMPHSFDWPLDLEGKDVCVGTKKSCVLFSNR